VGTVMFVTIQLTLLCAMSNKVLAMGCGEHAGDPGPWSQLDSNSCQSRHCPYCNSSVEDLDSACVGGGGSICNSQCYITDPYGVTITCTGDCVNWITASC